MIAQFARSSRTWTLVALGIILALGLVAMTDAVQAEDAAKPATQPAAAGTVQVEDGGSVLIGGAPPAPAVHEAGAALVDMAGRIDDARREYDRVRKSRGENNPDVIAAKTTLDSLLARRRELVVAQARAAAEASIKIQPGELVTVSIMSLMGPDVETVKTTRVDADGNINLPYIKEIKAQGLKPTELEEAVVKAYKQKAVMDNAVVAVSRPERGESHQLAKVRQAAPAPGMAMDPAMADPGLMASGMVDPAMMGIEAPGAPAPAVAIDPAIQKALDRKLPETKFQDVPLSDVFDFLRDVASTNIVVNWRGLEAAGVERSAPVTLNVKDVSLKDVIALVLKQQDSGVACTVENGVITIDVPNQPARSPKLVTKAYDVRDLLPTRPDGALFGGDQGGDAMSNLTRTIHETVAPDSWRQQGGPGNVSAYGTKLIITTTDDNHRDVTDLLEMLRDKPATQPAANSHAHH